MKDIDSILGTDEVCPDMSKQFDNTQEAIDYVENTKSPAKIGDKIIITEHAYNYFLSKCTEDELWDLQFLGCSEEHVKKVNIKF